EVGAEEAFAALGEGCVLVDVREPDEVAAGLPAGAIHLARGFLELRLEEVVPDPERRVLFLCASGGRSLFAAEAARLLGYRAVASGVGGLEAWRRAGLPVATRAGALSPEQRERYARHLAIPEVGEDGQRKLLESTVALVGAGGLGSPVALYLTAAGVGTLRIVDDDLVDRSNLQRQILHADDRIGQPKVDSARRTLEAFDPGIRVDARRLRLSPQNVEEVFDGCDVVVDGTDNFATRYLVNDACIKLGLPNVHGAVFRLEGQVSTFWPAYGGRRGPCYRCVFPSPPPRELAPSCAEAGVLGVLPGVVGTLQAVETLKLLLGIGDPLIGRLLCYDALVGRFLELEQRRDP